VNPKIYYWGDGTNIFFLQYKDNIFFCCLKTFFITGLTFFTHLFHPGPEINYWVMQIQKKRKKIWCVLEIVKIGEK
jgi:hypothetical protein